MMFEDLVPRGAVCDAIARLLAPNADVLHDLPSQKSFFVANTDSQRCAGDSSFNLHAHMILEARR